MIEKLDPIKHTDNLYDKNGFITNVACGGVVISKINELVDAVNSLRDDCNLLMGYIAPEDSSHPTVAKNASVTESGQEEHARPIAKTDPYAEQRRWIGKLCRFWDFPYEPNYFDTLKGITDNGLFIGHNGRWEYCEPVKPDDDVIYKGNKDA